MPRKPVLVEELGRGWGVALVPGGRFVRVRIPSGIGIGDELPARRFGMPARPAMAAAAAAFLFLGTLAFLVLKSEAETYALVTLRYAPAAETIPIRRTREGQQTQMTLALDRRGTVASVQPRIRTTQQLLGMRVEQAIKHTVGQNVAIANVELRSRRDAADSEKTDLETRIRTALPECEPPITVEIGPPVGDDDDHGVVVPPKEKREKSKQLSENEAPGNKGELGDKSESGNKGELKKDKKDKD